MSLRVVGVDFPIRPASRSSVFSNVDSTRTLFGIFYPLAACEESGPFDVADDLLL